MSSKVRVGVIVGGLVVILAVTLANLPYGKFNPIAFAQDSGPYEVPGCTLLIPASEANVEEGLVGVDADVPVSILVSTDNLGLNVVDTIAEPASSSQIFSIPPEYRNSDFWFSVEGCTRWYNASQLLLTQN